MRLVRKLSEFIVRILTVRVIKQFDCTLEYQFVSNISTPCSRINGTLMQTDPVAKIRTCNLTGTWEVFDADLEFACGLNLTAFGGYGNIFCKMCNPPERKFAVISPINET